MLLREHLIESGHRIFRWRSFILGVFLPAVIWAVSRGERVDAAFGALAGRLYDSACIALIAAGLLIRAYVVGHVPARTSGRNTASQVADELNTTGAYSLVRNPLYLGNALAYIGAVMLPQTWVLGLLMALVLIPYFERIIAAEEDFLVGKFGKPYTDWAQRTPAFFPRLSGWRPPALGLSLKQVIRRESPTWLGAATLIYLIAMGRAGVRGEALSSLTAWHAAFAAMVAFHLVVLALKFGTNLLGKREG